MKTLKILPSRFRWADRKEGDSMRGRNKEKKKVKERGRKERRARKKKGRRKEDGR